MKQFLRCLEATDGRWVSFYSGPFSLFVLSSVLLAKEFREATLRVEANAEKGRTRHFLQLHWRQKGGK